MAHIDLNKSEEIRRKIDETPIDLSNEHMNSLLTELFLKFKKPAHQNKEKMKKEKSDIPKTSTLRIQDLHQIRKDGYLNYKERSIEILRRIKWRIKEQLRITKQQLQNLNK